MGFAFVNLEKDCDFLYNIIMCVEVWDMGLFNALNGLAWSEVPNVLIVLSTFVEIFGFLAIIYVALLLINKIFRNKDIPDKEIENTETIKKGE